MSMGDALRNKAWLGKRIGPCARSRTPTHCLCGVLDTYALGVKLCACAVCIASTQHGVGSRVRTDCALPLGDDAPRCRQRQEAATQQTCSIARDSDSAPAAAVADANGLPPSAPILQYTATAAAADKPKATRRSPRTATARCSHCCASCRLPAVPTSAEGHATLWRRGHRCGRIDGLASPRNLTCGG